MYEIQEDHIMQLVQWNPFRELENSLLGLHRHPDHWVPPVDLRENKDNYDIAVELPGVDKDAIRVSLDGTTLSISAERKDMKTEEDNTAHIVERRYGKFERSFSLPQNIAAAKIKADYADGVLKLIIPKREQEANGAKEIAIS